MTLRHWLARLGGFGRIEAARGSVGIRRGRRRRVTWRDAPACFELLEDRTLLTVYTVNTVADTIDASDGLVSLREAVTAANSHLASGNAAAGSLDGDVIRFSLNTTQQIRLNPALGQLVIRDDLVIDGSSNPTRIAISGELGTRVFRINAGFGNQGANSRVEFRGFDVVAGQGIGDGENGGGAILVGARSEVTLRDVSVSGSRTASGGVGGGILNLGTLSLVLSTVSGNEATSGGGIYNTGTLSLFASQVLRNRATDGAARAGGGGIFNAGDDVTIGGTSLIALNQAVTGGGVMTLSGRLRVTGGGILRNTGILSGGGIAARADDGPAGPLTVPYDVQLTNLNLSYNIAGPNSAGNPPNVGDGGGYHGTGPGTVLINGGAAAGNIAAHQGGGLFNGLGGVMTLTGGRIFGNVASRGFDDGATENAGGGIFNAAKLVATDTQIGRNVAASNGTRLGLGGGVANASGGSARLTAALIDRNRAGLGGGVHNAAPPGTSFVDVLRSRLEFNEALRSGGGIANGGRLVVTDSSIDSNFALGIEVGDGGGGIFNDGGTADVRATFIVRNAALPADGSTAAGLGSGGGILNGLHGRLAVLDSTIEGNRARRDGGGVANYAGEVDDALNTVLLAGVFLRDNNANGPDTGRGGGLSSEGEGTVVLFRNVIAANDALLEGGGVWLDEGGTLQMDETTVSVNQTGGDGGGLHLRGAAVIQTSLIASDFAGGDGGGIWTDGTLNLVNSTVAENRSRGSGGGIYVASDEGTEDSVLIANATIARNRGDSEPNDAVTGTGGGLFIGAGEDVTLHNTVVALNTAGPGNPRPRDDVAGVANATSSFNLIGDGTGSSFVDGVNGNQVGTAVAPINPHLGLHLVDDGGPTRTYRPIGGSPLIDRGRDVLLTGHDQRLRPRPVDTASPNAAGGDGSDIGAVEVQ